MYNRLIDILQNQLALYEELLEMSRQKKVFLIKNNIEAIRHITARESSLISKLQNFEREREKAVSELAGRLRVPPRGLTLSEIVDRMNNSPARNQLADLRMRLRAGMDELKLLNEQNKALINQSLEYIDFTMNLLRSSVSGPIYAGAEEIHGQVFFDARG